MTVPQGLGPSEAGYAASRIWPAGLLADGDPAPVMHTRRSSPSPFLIVCDHGGNALPRGLELGVSRSDLRRHIGYDIGALAVAERVADALDAELVAQRYSRLVIDCNRPPHAADAMPVRVDGTDVPANVAIDPRQAAARVAELFHPYHRAIASSLDRRRERKERTIFIALHAFTPHHGDFPGPRPWPVSLLFRRGPELSEALRDLLAAEGLLVGMNEPYGVDDLSDYTIPVHAEARGLTATLIEIREDGIVCSRGQAEWADRLARLLPQAAARIAHRK